MTATSVLALAACGGPAGPAAVDTPSPVVAPTVEVPPEAASVETGDLPEGVEKAPPPSPPPCDDLSPGTEAYAGPAESAVLPAVGGKVEARANIFGAGHDAPPAPNGGGGGVPPPVFSLPSGASRVVAFPNVTGEVTPITSGPGGSAGYNDANGDRVGSTDVESYGGISGIVDVTNGMFLVGVFLDDAEPSPPAPPRLDFTLSNEREFVLAPEIGQVFLIGNGEGRFYVPPEEATRLFLGFSDAYLYEGCPGWYGNNAGELTVTIQVTTADA